MPLILPVQVICNTSDEAIYANVRANSRLPDKLWIRYVEPHAGVAVLCGSGPSLADMLGEIRERVAAGGKVFAMNGAAKFLHDNSIMPDYQVILDARIETADLIGPAREHLFASQVHPECFRSMPSARLWQLEVGGIDDLLPEYDKGYALIGGAASVGNTATCLAYAMGYRDLQIYGYDSSHRGEASHAFHQKMNDGDPCAYVDFAGKTYLCSLTMKLQAERFQDTAQALQACGCTITVHGDGLLPAMFNAPKEVITEAEKYARMWAQPDYRLDSPGERIADRFIDLVRPDDLVIDFGCGTGRAAKRIHQNGLPVMLVDLVENSRDEDTRALPFVCRDLSQPLDVRARYGFCTDVMEHIPTAQVEGVIRNIMQAASKVFFQISTINDGFGERIGHPLHLTVRPHAWWRNLFLSLGFAVTWDEEHEFAALFIVSTEGTTPCQA